MLALLLAGSLVVGAPVPKATKKPDDAKAILGRWEGKLAPVQENALVFLFRFAADGTCVSTDTKGREVPAEYTLHADGTPKRITWLEGMEREEWRCVYELDGDALKIGFVRPRKDTPEKLEFQDCSFVFELKRVTDDK